MTAKAAPKVINARKQAEAWASLKASLESMELDSETLHDTLEGEVDLLEALAALDREAIEAEIEATGLAVMIDTLNKRKGRALARIAAIKAIILQTMEIAEEKTLKVATATFSVREVKPKPIVTDESLLPSKFFKTPDPVVDKAAINAAFAELGENEAIPGVQLDNGGVSLSVRRA